MACTLFKASAPGSLMLLGEYAVLHGAPALVCAIDRRITVTLIPRTDKKIIIHSALGSYEADILLFQIISPFEFILTAIDIFRNDLRAGFDLKIESEFSEKTGLGSSAAVTVATLSVLSRWLAKNYSDNQLIELAVKVIRAVQGVGSGADAAASVLGGMVAYKNHSVIEALKLPGLFPLTVVYSGKKTRTGEAIKTVREKFYGSHRNIFEKIISGIGACAEDGIFEAKKGNVEALGEIMNLQQGFMKILGVSNSVLDEIVNKMSAMPGIMGVKISGSGLGDCVTGLGATTIQDCFDRERGIEQIFVNPSDQGVIYETR